MRINLVRIHIKSLQQSMLSMIARDFGVFVGSTGKKCIVNSRENCPVIDNNKFSVLFKTERGKRKTKTEKGASI